MQKTSEIYRLRKSGQLEEAYNLAYELYSQYESDEDVKKHWLGCWFRYVRRI